MKPGYHGSEPADIRAYAAAHPEFPHESTADQWFSESQMESYRALGSHIIGKICRGGGETPEPSEPLDLSDFIRQVSSYLGNSQPKPPTNTTIREGV